MHHRNIVGDPVMVTPYGIRWLQTEDVHVLVADLPQPYARSPSSSKCRHAELAHVTYDRRASASVAILFFSVHPSVILRRQSW